MRIAHIFAGLAFLVLTACHGGRLATPSGFATLDSDDAYSYRATNAQGVVLGVRTEDNDVKANVNFWADALDLRLKNQGYAPLAQPSDARTRGGLRGRQMRYEVTREGRTEHYWLTIFATEKKVYVVEAAGDKEVFDSASPLVESAIESLKL
jgi:hypothetical protein